MIYVTVFKSKVAKTIGIGLLAAGLAVAASKPLGDLYDKVVIENWAAKSVENWLDSQYPIPRLKYNE